MAHWQQHGDLDAGAIPSHPPGVGRRGAAARV